MSYRRITVVVMVCDDCGEKEKISLGRDNSIRVGRGRGWQIRVVPRGVMHKCPKCVKANAKGKEASDG